MNIKIVFNTKTHKVSQKHQTLEEIKNAIKALYPQQLEGGFDLYVTLHPQMEPFKILDEFCFTRIKDIYHQFQWSSIKFLVKDLINPNLTNDDLSILNQSVVAQSNVQLSTFNDLFQYKPQNKEEEIPNQKQNIVIEEIKPEPHFVQQIINEVQKQEVQDFDYQSEEFKQFIIAQIDERLKYHGILQNLNKNPQTSEYKMQLTTKNFKKSEPINQKFEQQIQIVNTGDQIWRKGEVVLMGVSGFYHNKIFQLEQDILPGKVAKINLKLNMPNQPVQNLLNEFQLAYKMENQYKFFGEKVEIVITANQKHSNQPNSKKIDQKKVQQLMDNAEISKEQAIQFIELYGAENTIDELILAYIEQFK